MTDYKTFRNQLASVYAPNEAAAIARLVFEKVCGLSLADVYAGKDTELFADTEEVLQKTLARLMNNEPVQYVLGVADFCGREFAVNPDVLIPRPETEELCAMVKLSEGSRVLDVCTGSGCIAITLALSAKNVEVKAFDISEAAVATATVNAARLGADVDFFVADALQMDEGESSRFKVQSSRFKVQSSRFKVQSSRSFDVIISNPPYICENERQQMERNVLDYEPDKALFVPDSDPLLFYRAITDYAATHLYDNGRLYFEVNPRYADEVAAYATKCGFAHTKVVMDSFGKKRFVEGMVKCSNSSKNGGEMENRK